MIKYKNKLALIFGVLFILLYPCHAQTANISLEHIGYGENNRDVYLIVRNTGTVFLSQITFYVDGFEYPSQGGEIGPGKGFRKEFYLNPGEHLIEVKTFEGANDSLIIETSYIREEPSPTPENKPTSFLDKNRIWLILVIVAVIMVIIWLLTRKPKLM